MTLLAHPAVRLLAVFALLCSCLFITGCSGCRDDVADDKALTKEEKEKKEKEKPKPDFVTRTPVLLPGWFPPAKSQQEKKDLADDVAAAYEELNNPAIRNNRTKLGHWVEANLPAIANNYNADGQLTTYSTTPAGQPVPVPSTDYFLTTNRPASLAKSEWKNLETSVFLPRRDMRTSVANVSYTFSSGTGGIPYINLGQPTSLMKPFQYHIVLLSDRQEVYSYLKLTDSVQLRGQLLGNGDIVPPFYYIVPSVFGDPVPLPRQSLNWTTIAYLMWDDFDPEKLSRDQQESLLDWLHFGGQVILSGPDCLDRLQNSFLGDYLPAQFDGSTNITNADLADLNENWTVPVTKNKAEKQVFQISDSVPLLGVKFKPHADAKFVDGMGELAIERQVGRGRILVTGFSLSAPAVRKWRSFPSFVNNVLLRRPARHFLQTPDLDVSFKWTGNSTTVFDPLIGSTVRYISRDLGIDGTPAEIKYSMEDENLTARSYNAYPSYGMGMGDPDGADGADETIGGMRNLNQESKLQDDTNHWHFGGFADAPQSGVGGWNDDSGVAVAARETLKEAAGITPPSSKFVLKMLAGYLLVLVPLNWLVFRLMGRVEWAWAAAPFIAIVGAVLVVRMAALDIGFVRSNTQIGLLEIHASYPRAHATEYSALYTSLSTRYNVDLDNATAQSLPFARVNESLFLKPTETYSAVRMKRAVSSRLEGFQIQSNSTGLLHTEYMLDLEGTLYATFGDSDAPTIINNGTVLNLQNAGVVRRLDNDEYEVAWIGDIVAGSASPELKFETVAAESFSERWRRNRLFVSSGRLANTLWNRSIGESSKAIELSELKKIPELADRWETYASRLRHYSQRDDEENSDPLITRAEFKIVYSSLQNDSEIKIGRLFDTIANGLQLARGEVRLLATTDQRLGRTKFDPEATQTDQQTLVVVHLKRPELPIARRDDNAMTDFTRRSDLDWERQDTEIDELYGE